MLTRVAASSARVTRPLCLPQVQKRFVSAKTLKLRLTVVKNIQKITTSMKMVAAAKLRKSEEGLLLAREFSAPVINFWPEAKQEITPTSAYLYVPITSDRGLCGGVNSAVVREVRSLINKRVSSGHTNINLIPYGEKGRAGLERVYGKYFSTVVTELQKSKRIGFKQAAKATELLLNTKFDAGEIVYNKYKNMVSYITTAVPLQPLSVLLNDTTALQPYELEGGNDILENLYEFKLAVRVFQYLCDMDTSELSARMTAMSNSSKSAGEMIDALRLLYNRTRQAKITIELIEIISGASAAEETKSD